MAEVITIPQDLTGDELAKLVFAKGKRASNTLPLEDDTKYALVLLKLHPSVTPADYATLKTDVVAVAGIQGVDLLVDHETKESVPANHTQMLHVLADIQLRDDTP